MKKLLFAAAGLLALTIGASAQVTAPQVPTVNSNDLFQDVVNGNPQAGNLYATANQLAAFVTAQPGSSGFKNSLIGGDATTNLFQRGTTGSSVTTTVTYGGPDRWAYWSGTNTAMTVSRDSTAADLTPGYQYAFKMARTSGQTGVVQVCMAQEVESSITYQYQSNTAEFLFRAVAGANFSAASNLLQVYIVTGTGVDEGMQKLAWGLNAGGGGSTAWTGQANTLAGSVAISPTSVKYVAAASIPSTATEMAVVLCWTPTGTAGTNDYVALSGLQLDRNDALSSAVGLVQSSAQINSSSIERRPIQVETALQQRYFYQLTDSGAATVRYALGQATTTAAAVFIIPFPVPMRIAPTAVASATTAFGDTATAGAATACTGFAIVASATSTTAGAVTCTAGATMTAGGASQLVGAATSANVNFSAEL